MAAVSPRHSHNSVRHFHGHHPISSSFSVVCGRVLHASEQTVSGRNGDHLQFFLDIGGEKRYQIDINVRSKYGTNIEVYFADEELPGPFEFQYGEFPAEVSYYKLGLKDEQFSQVGERWITNKLEAELNNAKFVEIFGTTFANGRLMEFMMFIIRVFLIEMEQLLFIPKGQKMVTCELGCSKEAQPRAPYYTIIWRAGVVCLRYVMGLIR